MKRRFVTYGKAGMVFRFLGWLQLAADFVLLLKFYIPVLARGGRFTSALDFVLPPLIVAGIAAIAVFLLTVGKAIKEHKNWGRTAGIVVAVIQLFGFPIGTVIGGYILWCLISGWAIPEADRAETSAADDVSRS